MGTRKQTSKSRSKPVPAAPGPERQFPSLAALQDAIEGERLRLMKAHSVLDCVVTAMEAEDGYPRGGPYYPSLITMAGELVDESIRQLDSVNLRANAARIERSLEEDETEAPEDVTDYRKTFEVREPRAEYVVTRQHIPASEPQPETHDSPIH